MSSNPNNQIEFSSNAEYLQCAFNLVSKIIHHDAAASMECSISVMDHVNSLELIASIAHQMDFDTQFIDDLKKELIQESGEF